MKKKYFSIALAVVMLALTLALLIPVSSTIGVLSEPLFLHREEKGFGSTS